MRPNSAYTMEFHVSRQARDLYKFDESLFALNGNVILANFHASRVFAQNMNDKRDLTRFPELAVKAGQINAMGLIDELLHSVVAQYRQERNPQVMGQALAWLEQRLGRQAVDETLRRFADEFPPLAVYRREIGLDEYLQGQTAGVPHRQVVLEELILLWLANENPAFSPFLELFDDSRLEKGTAYHEVITSLDQFFRTQPTFGPDSQYLLDLLREPAIRVPHSLTGQLEYIREKWGVVLGRYLYRLLGGLDLVREEQKLHFMGPGPTRPLEFRVGVEAGAETEAERYSPDRAWMPRVVLLAKSSYVWLDQLSKKYRRPITRLDQVPDEELDTMARWGFTALWLIGVWERSKASRRIKQLCGNPEAAASAYAVYDYVVAADLGGEEAFENLRARAAQRGIRMAGDMVPNHVGIDGRWVIEHPDWFISLDYSPFPSHTFSAEDLSSDGRVGIFLEDHYYNHTDAAVVFKRLDRWTGNTRYIYHGNDGTSMPWNDTAQLNYLNPEVREAAIQTILNVARKFAVIRFDAAMTLTKKHYQRLWFPEPGSGGAIPTRAEHGLTRAQLDAAMPQEFWREVVDRVAQEAPDTLLLAEAFWLMEGYFVRTLGMHRVYNSAFMNMLKAEENSKYRTTIKNILEFDPEILKRFVNFMNNPDEQTAVAQFGKDDKYFGVCTMMVTMPGLPMFGHGQVEGFTEKYGMEYRRAYWDEIPDEGLIRRHEREVFPLLHRRPLFAEVTNFRLYDFYTAEGYVNEDVFAYSNRLGDERALVVYHNRYATARGWIRRSSAYTVKGGDNGDRVLAQTNLGEGLGLHNQDDYFCIFRDHVSGLEYIRNSHELHDKGLYIELNAFKCHVFLDFREVQDNTWHHYANLAAYLNGRSVPSIEEALKETFLQPVHQAFKELANADMFRRLMDARLVEPGTEVDEDLLQDVEQKAMHLLQEVARFSGTSADSAALARGMRHELVALLQLPIAFQSHTSRHSTNPAKNAGRSTGSAEGSPANDAGCSSDSEERGTEYQPTASEYEEIAEYLAAGLNGDPGTWGNLLGWWCVHSLGKVAGETATASRHLQGETGFVDRSRSWIDEWLLGKVLAGALQDLGLDENAGWRAVAVIKLLTSHQDSLVFRAMASPKAASTPELAPSTPGGGLSGVPQRALVSAHAVLENLLKDDEVQQFLRVNRYGDVLWFNKEAFEQLLWWLFTVAVVQLTALRPAAEAAPDILAAFKVIRQLQQAEEQSGYQLEELVRLLLSDGEVAAPAAVSP
jgi:glycosidase